MTEQTITLRALLNFNGTMSECVNAEQAVRSAAHKDLSYMMEVTQGGAMDVNAEGMTPRETAEAWVKRYQENASDTLFDRNEESYDLWVDDIEAAMSIYEKLILEELAERAEADKRESTYEANRAD